VAKTHEHGLNDASKRCARSKMVPSGTCASWKAS